MSCEKVSIFFPNLFEAVMSEGEDRVYRFRSFLLNVDERQLFDGGREISLQPKTFDVLVHLVENAGHLVNKHDLMNAVWSDAFVEEVNVPRAVHHLRKILKQDNNGSRFIETIPTKGYRFTMPVVGPDDIKGGTNAKSHAVADTEADRRERWLHPLRDDELPSSVILRRRPILLGGLITVLLVLGGFWFAGGGSLGARLKISGQSPPTRNSGAYRLYLEGKVILDRSYKDDYEVALKKFEEAIELDPSFSLAYAGKADADWRIFHGPRRTHDVIAGTRASIKKALELDANNAYALTLLCRINATYDWDFSAAERSCRRAVELDPKNHDARMEIAMFLNQFARHDEALAEADAGIALAPTSFNKHQRGIILFYARRYSEAIEQLEQIWSADPKFQRYPSGFLWWSYAMEGDHAKAVETYIDPQQWPEGAGGGDEARSIYLTQGWRGFQETVARNFRLDGPRRVLCAALHCQLGNKDQTFEFLEAALKDRELWMIHLLGDPRFEPCRDDKRFDQILKRVGVL